MTCENVSSGILDQVRFKSACSATEASSNLETLDIASRHITISHMALDTFSHDLAQTWHKRTCNLNTSARKTQLKFTIFPWMTAAAG